MCVYVEVGVADAPFLLHGRSVIFFAASALRPRGPAAERFAVLWSAPVPHLTNLIFSIGLLLAQVCIFLDYGPKISLDATVECTPVTTEKDLMSRVDANGLQGSSSSS